MGRRGIEVFGKRSLVLLSFSSEAAQHEAQQFLENILEHHMKWNKSHFLFHFKKMQPALPLNLD